MAYKKVSQKVLTSLPAFRKRTTITGVGKPIVKKTTVTSTPVGGRSNAGTQIAARPNATVIKKPISGIGYVSTTPSTARSSLRAALLKNKKKKG